MSIEQLTITRYRNAKGQLHRIDGPAEIDENGNKSWYLNGKRHRIDGPAIEWSDGSDGWWYRNGKLHRYGGPAKIWPDGAEGWYCDGIKWSDEYIAKHTTVTLHDIQKLLKNFTSQDLKKFLGK